MVNDAFYSLLLFLCREKRSGSGCERVIKVQAMDNNNSMIRVVAACELNAKKLERVVWFKHDTGHVNMAFIDYDG